MHERLRTIGRIILEAESRRIWRNISQKAVFSTRRPKQR